MELERGSTRSHYVKKSLWKKATDLSKKKLAFKKGHGSLEKKLAFRKGHGSLAKQSTEVS